MSIILDWLNTMGKIMIKPTSKTILEEAKRSKGKSSSVYFLLVFAYGLLQLVVGYIFEPSIRSDLYSVIIIGLILPIVFFFYVFCLKLVAKHLFRRKTDYLEEMLYLLTAIFLIIFVFLLISMFIPYGNYIGMALLGYSIYLNVLTLKTLTNLKSWQALVTIFIAMLLGIPGILCIPVFILNITDAVPGLLGG